MQVARGCFGPSHGMWSAKKKPQMRGGGSVSHHKQVAAAADFLAGGEETDQRRCCLINVTAAEKRKRRGRLVQRASADPSPCCHTFKFVHLLPSFMRLVASVWRPTVRARGTSWVSKTRMPIPR